MAEKNILVHLDGNLNELQNWKYQQLVSDPGAPTEGQFWWNTTENRLKHYDGTAVKTVAVLSDITSAMDFKGGYDASANTPNLDSAPTAGTIFQGDFYYVTVGGTFYTETVEVGDALIANTDDPASLADWTRVQFNVDQATETIRGVAEIATQVETDAGTNDTNIVTPLKLATYVANKNITAKFAVDLDGAGEASVTRVFAGGVTTFTVVHNLAEADVQIEVKEIASGEQILASVDTVDANTVDIAFNGTIADDVYRVVVIG
jgi:hypothetical protein